MAQNQIANNQVASLANTGDASLIIKRVTIDFGNLSASGGTDTKTASVSGASVGDGVSVLNTVDPTANMVVFGWVSSSNTVTVRATNCTPGSYNPPSQDFVIIVAKVT